MKGLIIILLILIIMVKLNFQCFKFRNIWCIDDPLILIMCYLKIKAFFSEKLCSFLNNYNDEFKN
jgi:hypothetical protein